MKRNYTVGVLIGNANSPHSMDVIKGIYRTAKAKDINIVFYLGIRSYASYRTYFKDDAEDDFEYQVNVVYDYTEFSKLDCMIVQAGSLSIYLDNVKNKVNTYLEDIPYVLMEDLDEAGIGSSIITDNYNSMKKLITHMIEVHDCTEITYLAGPIENMDAKQRKQAYQDTLNAYHLPCDDSRIEYGDFTNNVKDQVNRLLDRHPEMDAMICANDLMADCAYTELEKRGIEVGKDILVTGYDDWVVSEYLSPPLTTVRQNAYEMGVMSVLEALRLCEGKKPRATIAPAEVVFRESCGCKKRDQIQKWKKSILYSSPEDMTDLFIRRVSRGYIDPVKMTEIRRYVGVFLGDNIAGSKEQDTYIECLKQFLNQIDSYFISLKNFEKELESFLYNRAIICGEQGGSITQAGQILRFRHRVHEIIMNYSEKSKDAKAAAYQLENWFLPLISKDMISKMHDETEFYASAVKKLFALKAQSTYLYLFEKPIQLKRGEEWKAPEQLYLAASQIGKEIKSYPVGQRPVMSRSDGFAIENAGSDTHGYYVFCLYSDDIQYGVLITEIDPDNLVLSYQITMQITNALKFYELTKQERKVREQLEEANRALNEKNMILNNLSSYDSMIGCLNRRGFMEATMDYNKQHVGEKAIFIYADLNNLKQINDIYGHNEGDFAIVFAEKMLRKALGEETIIGRLGGDEFACLLRCKSEECEKKIRASLRQTSTDLNTESFKPYRVEVSIGVTIFECVENISLESIMRDADKKLYIDKMSKRVSVYK